MRRVTRASLAAAKATAAETARSTAKIATVGGGNRSSQSSPPETIPSSPFATVTPSPRKPKSCRNQTSVSVTETIPKNDPKPSVVLNRERIQQLVASSVLGEKSSHGKSETPVATLNTQTMGGWCLVDALVHCAEASDGILAPLISKHGPPGVYLEHLRDTNIHKHNDQPKGTKQDMACKDKYGSFRSLCRTVAGQQLAGAAADTIWRRLVGVVVGGNATSTKSKTEDNCCGSSWYSQSSLEAFTPKALLKAVETETNEGTIAIDTDKLRKPAGLSKAKCDCILAIARCFETCHLSEAFLMENADDAAVRERLLSIKGLGPWSVDMFLMFRCHRSNVFPIGDLAVRNGTAALWKIQSTKTKKALCPKKDAATLTNLHAPFEPYRSISSYYMYKVVGDAKTKKKKEKKHPASPTKAKKRRTKL